MMIVLTALLVAAIFGLFVCVLVGKRLKQIRQADEWHWREIELRFRAEKGGG